MIKRLLLLLAIPSLIFAQNPATQNPIVHVNSAFVNGVAPGYAWTYAATGLTLNIGPGAAICANTPQAYAGGTLTMTNSTTNYVYVSTSTCLPASNTSGFTAATLPLYAVITSGGNITSVVEYRGAPQTPSASGLGTVTSVATTGGLTGGPITSTGTLDMTAAQKTRNFVINVGAKNATALVTADIQPQDAQSDIPAAMTVTLVVAYVDAGASTVQVGYRHNGSTTAITGVLTPATVGGITDPVACANTGGTAITLQGNSVTCGTLTNTALTAHDVIETIGGAADATSKHMNINVNATVN